MTMPTIILASSSPYRRMLMDRLMLPYMVVSPDVDETNPGLPPEKLAPYLAELKARKVSEQFPEAICIGGDQVPVCRGEVLQKPGTLERNISQLQQLSGERVAFHAGVCILYPPKNVCSASVHTSWVQFRTLTLAEILHYVEKEPSIDCAGACKIESLGISLVEAVEATPDPTALIGLPLMTVMAELKRCGVDVLC